MKDRGRARRPDEPFRIRLRELIRPFQCTKPRLVEEASPYPQSPSKSKATTLWARFTRRLFWHLDLGTWHLGIGTWHFERPLIRVLTAFLVFGALPLRAEPETTSSFGAIPDVEVQDQTGRTLHFYSDLMKGKTVAVNFLFTGCSTVCPQLGASSAALARLLAERPDDRFRVISISIDPGADTPEQLREWSDHFGAAPGWTLVTGKRRDIDTLLRALQVYSADKNLHSGNFLLGNESAGSWRRVPGTTAPTQIVTTLRELAEMEGRGPPPSATPVTAAGSYFSDVTLINQQGESRRFYEDLVKGRIVVINTIFTDCSTVCPITVERFAQVQAQLGERVGRDVFLLSISVDPATDTPEILQAYATRAGAKPGWQFLTGDKGNVDRVLKKLGQYVEARDAHSNIIIVGNEPTGLWKKAFGLAPIDEITRVIESVANDGVPP